MFEAEGTFIMQFSQLVHGQFDKVEKENHVAASKEKLGDTKGDLSKNKSISQWRASRDTETWRHKAHLNTTCSIMHTPIS